MRGPRLSPTIFPSLSFLPLFFHPKFYLLNTSLFSPSSPSSLQLNTHSPFHTPKVPSPKHSLSSLTFPPVLYTPLSLTPSLTPFHSSPGRSFHHCSDDKCYFSQFEGPDGNPMENLEASCVHYVFDLSNQTVEDYPSEMVYTEVFEAVKHGQFIFDVPYKVCETGQQGREREVVIRRISKPLVLPIILKHQEDHTLASPLPPSFLSSLTHPSLPVTRSRRSR